MPRVGVLAPGRPPNVAVEAFRRGLRDLGYVEEQNIVLMWRWDEDRPDRHAAMTRDLLQLNADLIVAGSTVASIAAQNVTKTIPIVMLAVGDPVGAGLVTSPAQPGGNVTGTSFQNVEVAGKSLELLKSVMPKLRVVTVLWNPANPVFQGQMVKETEAAARSLGIQLRMLAARDAKEIESAFAAMTGERTEALTVLADPVFSAHLARIAALAVNGHLPSICAFREYADAGGLMGYSANFTERGRRTAVYVDKILKGAKPGDLPVEQPTKYELVINLKTAKALGLTIPPSLLARADQVIE
jgi:putative ABC transport system substrate-binding protein